MKKLNFHKSRIIIYSVIHIYTEAYIYLATITSQSTCNDHIRNPLANLHRLYRGLSTPDIPKNNLCSHGLTGDTRGKYLCKSKSDFSLLFSFWLSTRTKIMENKCKNIYEDVALFHWLTGFRSFFQVPCREPFFRFSDPGMTLLSF